MVRRLYLNTLLFFSISIDVQSMAMPSFVAIKFYVADLLVLTRTGKTWQRLKIIIAIG